MTTNIIITTATTKHVHIILLIADFKVPRRHKSPVATSLNVGAIVGGVLGGLLGLVILTLALLFYCRNKNGATDVGISEPHYPEIQTDGSSKTPVSGETPFSLDEAPGRRLGISDRL
jgi:hypothetical protein